MCRNANNIMFNGFEYNNDFEKGQLPCFKTFSQYASIFYYISVGQFCRNINLKRIQEGLLGVRVGLIYSLDILLLFVWYIMNLMIHVYICISQYTTFLQLTVYEMSVYSTLIDLLII